MRWTHAGLDRIRCRHIRFTRLPESAVLRERQAAVTDRDTPSGSEYRSGGTPAVAAHELRVASSTTRSAGHAHPASRQHFMKPCVAPASSHHPTHAVLGTLPSHSCSEGRKGLRAHWTANRVAWQLLHSWASLRHKPSRQHGNLISILTLITAALLTRTAVPVSHLAFWTSTRSPKAPIQAILFNLGYCSSLLCMKRFNHPDQSPIDSHAVSFMHRVLLDKDSTRSWRRRKAETGHPSPPPSLRILMTTLTLLTPVAAKVQSELCIPEDPFSASPGDEDERDCDTLLSR